MIGTGNRLSGITRESTDRFVDFTSCGFSAPTACFASRLGTFDFTGPGSWGTFTVTSSVLTTGLVSFQIQTSQGTITGQVSGPVAAAVPEPATLSLLFLRSAALT
jgi:hypothetical protein